MTTNGHAPRLDGRRVVITGGTSGIGLEAARHALAEGARVLVTGSSQGSVDRALADLDGAEGIVADVRDLAALGGLAQAARERLGGVDVLMANAGIGVMGPLEAVTEDDYDAQMGVNVKGVFFTVQRLLPLMDEGASVVLTASAVNARGGAGASLYFASKAAVRSLARSLAAELGPRGIRVNSLSPGVVRSGFQSRAAMDDERGEGFIDAIVAQTPLGRVGTAEEMARAFAYLASSDSAYVTAADLVVDGGRMDT